MQISKTSNTNFGIIIRNNIKIFDDVKIYPSDFRLLTRITDKLNATDAKGITVFGEVGQPNVTGRQKAFRITTSPTHLDMDVIRSFRPDAQIHDYKRRSKWVPLDLSFDTIIENLGSFIKRQKGFINHCKVDPRHSATPFDRPAWQPSLTRKEFTHSKTNLSEWSPFASSKN